MYVKLTDIVKNYPMYILKTFKSKSIVNKCVELITTN